MKTRETFGRIAICFVFSLFVLAFLPTTINTFMPAVSAVESPTLRQEFYPRIFVDVAKETKKSVVCVQLKILIPAESPAKSSSYQVVSASGFFADKTGFIITNKHVVESGTDIRVMLLNGEVFPAGIVAIHPLLDLAIIKISGSADRAIYPIKLGDSSLAETGEMVIAIGNPFGLLYTVTMGIISALERQINISGDEKSPRFCSFIQTDAAINPGNSGGPLINLDKEAIGINTMIIGQTNIGLNFAIPINFAKDFLIEAEKARSSSQGWIGVYFQKAGIGAVSKIKQQKSVNVVLISRVEQNSPAEKAGLKQSDVIAYCNGAAVKDHLQLEMEIQRSVPRKIITFDVLRGEKISKIKITVGQRPSD